MKKLKDNENLIIYKVGDMKSDIELFGGDPDNEELVKRIYFGLNRVIDKCDLWREINDCIQEQIDEKNNL